MKKNYIKNKCISLIMTMIILFVTVFNETDNIFGADATIITVTVIDGKGEYIKDAVFEGVELVDESGSENGIYKVSTTETTGSFTVTDDIGQVKKTVEFDTNDNTPVTVELSNEWGFEYNNDENVSYDNDTGKYTITTKYQTENSMYILNVTGISKENLGVPVGYEKGQHKFSCFDPDCNETECDEGSAEVTGVEYAEIIENANTKKEMTISYNSVGKAEIIIKPVSKYYRDIEVDLDIKNEIFFLTSNNTQLNNDSGIDIESKDGVISKITKNLGLLDSISTADNLGSININANALYDDIFYKVGEEKVASSNFIIDRIGNKTITAVCKKTGESKSIDFCIKGYSEGISIKKNNQEVDYVQVKLEDFKPDVDSKVVDVFFNDNRAYYYYKDITYSSSNSEIADVEVNTGDIYVKKAGTVTITAVAKPKDEYKFLEDATGSYTLQVSPKNVTLQVKNIIDGEIYENKNIIGTVSDTSDYFKYEENGNGELFTLPIKVIVNGSETENVKIESSIDGVTISNVNNKFVIDNPDLIERNTPLELKITTKLDNSMYENITGKFYIIISGEHNNNQENKYYTINVSISNGADGNKWFRGNPADIRILGQEYTLAEVTKKYGISKDNNGYFSSTYNPKLTSNTNKANKEVKFFVKDPNYVEAIIQREYFGIDNQAPLITQVSISQGNVTSHGIYSNEDIKFNVTVKDNEKNLYDVSVFYAEDVSFYDGESDTNDLIVNGNVINENLDMDKAIDNKQIYVAGSTEYENCQEYNTEFVIAKDLFSDEEAKDFVVIVRDKAGNCKAEHLGILLNNNEDSNDVLIEENKPDGKISFPEGTDVYNNKGINYIGEHTDLNIYVTDTQDGNATSGLASFKLLVNGNTYIDTANNFVDNRFQNQDILISGDEKVLSKTFKLNTSDFVNDTTDTITIELVDIYDNAGNRKEKVEFVVCVDKTPGNVKLEKIETADKVNISSYGNFFNQKVTLTFDVSDNASGVDAVNMIIGKLVLVGNINNGKVKFDLPLGTVGDAKINIIDKVNNDTTYNLSKTCQGKYNINENDSETKITNNYIQIEHDQSDITINEDRKPDASNKWYNHAVKFNILINDKKGSASSNIKSYAIYINNQEYKNETYNNNLNERLSFDIVLGNDEISKYANNDGTYTVRVISTDNAGNNSERSKTVYIDNVAPIIESVTGVDDNSFNTGVVTLFVKVNEKHWNEENNKTYVEVEKTLDGVTTKETIYGTNANSAKNTYKFTFEADGTYKVTANSIDASANKAVTRTVSFTVDNTSPIVDITGVVENAYYKDSISAIISVIESNFDTNSVNIEVTKELLGEKTVLATKEFISTAKDSKLEIRFDEEGTYTIKADATDKATNTSITRTVIFTVDSESPKIKISGVKNQGAYKDDVIPKVEISDNYYKNYSIKLTKTGVYFGDSSIDIDNVKDIDVTKTFITNVSSVERGIEGTFDTFEKKQSNDGVYTLTVTATDYADRVSTEVVTFSVNRFGSVYTFSDSLKNMMNAYAKEVTEDFVITEYNADEILDDSIKVEIVRDGTPVEFNDDNISIDIVKKGTDETGWYKNVYTISKENFVLDGIYSVTVSSTDIAGNHSQSIVYDQFDVRFCIDNTKPDLVKVTGLSKSTYNANQIEVTYEVFDSIGIKEVRVYLNGKLIQTVNEFNDLTVYEGKFMIGEGVDQQIRFEVEDMAGNVVDSSNEEDIESGKIASFSTKITVTTNVLIRWYSNKILFISSIIGMVCLIGVVTLVVVAKRKKAK